MRFKDVFSIIGPAMVGPSSSHTAGAVRLGRVARQLLGCRPDRAEVTFYGSFAQTYLGHGTDLAIVGGLLDYDTDDLRIAHSLSHAKAAGIRVELRQGAGPAPAAHPNTARIRCFAPSPSPSPDGSQTAAAMIDMTGMSVGGGTIEIARVDGFPVRFSAVYFTLVLWHSDRQGLIADAAGLLHRHNVNICSMETGRKERGGDALTVFETDAPVPDSLLLGMRALAGVRNMRVVNLADKTGE
ncbi:L-serine ammonia-lyase, iron-sulfur-dependent subunit beta [Paenibacillus doosanensis]|uniref:L-serine ammonia-lyase, iron-sulfur-dependent subunit beta n=1 Tax=Paenibacillus doosanensis TaxID=1229154 RepID=UPI002180334C|nr:L-serine ammonia-lyase, iron-sulfur-dependent subunit beta [Paenibacillus doosanensis]MCS7462013.1 L-serine ammonia-lyase, iron-sulfur-dependent subunit beta [Paenibacillus doosanensis]